MYPETASAASQPTSFRRVELNYAEAERDCQPDELLAWQQALNATGEYLSTKPAGTVLVAPLLGSGFFLAEGESDGAELWRTDWDEDLGLSWDGFTQKACDKQFAGDGWAPHVTRLLQAVLLRPRKDLEFVPGLRVEMRPSLVATLCGDRVTLV